MHKLADLIGVPFVDGGRDPKTGLDCLGLARIAFDRINGARLPGEYVKESDTNDVKSFFSQSLNEWERIDRPETGCAVAMRLDPRRPELVQHLGVYIGNGYILQTLKKRGAHRIRIDDPLFGKTIEGFYRWKSSKTL